MTSNSKGVLLARTILCINFMLVGTVLAAKEYPVTLFCDNSEFINTSESSSPRKWTTFLIDMYPTHITISGSVYFDGAHKINLGIDGRILIVAGSDKNGERINVNLNRYNGNINLSQIKDDTGIIRYILDAKCSQKSQLF